MHLSDADALTNAFDHDGGRFVACVEAEGFAPATAVLMLRRGASLVHDVHLLDQGERAAGRFGSPMAAALLKSTSVHTSTSSDEPRPPVADCVSRIITLMDARCGVPPVILSEKAPGIRGPPYVWDHARFGRSRRP